MGIAEMDRHESVIVEEYNGGVGANVSKLFKKVAMAARLGVKTEHALNTGAAAKARQQGVLALGKPPDERNTEDIAAILAILTGANAKVLDELTLERKMMMAQRVTYETHEEGTELWKEGDVGDCFYILLTGKATVVKWDSQREKDCTVANLRVGAGFGEVALQSDDCKRAAGVLCETKCALIKVLKDDYNHVLKSVDHEKIERRVQFLRRVSIFGQLPPASLTALAMVLREKTLPHNSVICREGCDAEELCFLAHGEVRIIKAVKTNPNMVLPAINSASPRGSTSGASTPRAGKSVGGGGLRSASMDTVDVPTVRPTPRHRHSDLGDLQATPSPRAARQSRGGEGAGPAVSPAKASRLRGHSMHSISPRPPQGGSPLAAGGSPHAPSPRVSFDSPRPPPAPSSGLSVVRKTDILETFLDQAEADAAEEMRKGRPTMNRRARKSMGSVAQRPSMGGSVAQQRPSSSNDSGLRFSSYDDIGSMASSRKSDSKPKKKFVEVGILPAGAFFGEVGLLGSGKHESSVISLGTCLIMTLSKFDIHRRLPPHVYAQLLGKTQKVKNSNSGIKERLEDSVKWDRYKLDLVNEIRTNGNSLTKLV